MKEILSSHTSNRPKISIMVITYNHEKYIAQTLESVLMQETEYSYEIVVIEDCSTDRTQEIIMQYVQKYPDKVKPYFNKTNIGYPVTQKNFYQGYYRLTGDYMAILEGDDYWTSPHKLQKQVSFLENNPDFAACSHNTIKIYTDGSKEPHRFIYSENTPSENGIESIIMLTPYFHTTTLLFRNVFRGAPPIHLSSKWSCEIFLTIAHAQFGKIKYFDEDMAVYRAHPGGVFSTMAIRAAWFWNIGGLRRYNQWLKYRYLKAFSRSIIKYCNHVLADKGKEAELLTRYQYVKYFGIRMIYQIISAMYHLFDFRGEIHFKKMLTKDGIISLINIPSILVYNLITLFITPSRKNKIHIFEAYHPNLRKVRKFLALKTTDQISYVYHNLKTIRLYKSLIKTTARFFINLPGKILYKSIMFFIPESIKNKIKNYETHHPKVKRLRNFLTLKSSEQIKRILFYLRYQLAETPPQKMFSKSGLVYCINAPVVLFYKSLLFATNSEMKDKIRAFETQYPKLYRLRKQFSKGMILPRDQK